MPPLCGAGGPAKATPALSSVACDVAGAAARLIAAFAENAPLRAERYAEKATCPGCQHTDTVGAWQRMIVGALDPMTDASLARYLRRLGMRTTALGIRHRVARGTLPGPVGRDAFGRDLYDAYAALAVLVTRDAPAAEGA